ncbi:MAG TPA: hypothetical protein VK934_00265 [Fimbriimonas sp.]|nr:hypothetical protein [Fimbriimonas sp.]
MSIFSRWLGLLFIAVAALSCTSGQLPAPPEAPASPEGLAAQADIPIYPNAVLPDQKSNVRSDGKQTRYELVISTSDAPQKVSEFYQEKLKLKAHKDGTTIRLLGRTPKGFYAKIDVTSDGKTTKIDAVSIAGDF